MKLSKEDVFHIARLGRLHLTDAEAERYASELTRIFDYIDPMTKLDTDGVPETSQVTGLSNVSRPDELRTPDQELCRPQELLDCSPLPQKQGQLSIKRMM